MAAFWVFVCAVSIVTVGLLVRAVLRRRPVARSAESHRALHNTRLAELQRDIDHDTIAAHEKTSAEQEIARALLEESDLQTATDITCSRTTQWVTAITIICVVPGIALATYLKLGQPSIATGKLTTEATTPAPFDAAQVDELIVSLEQRLADDPESVEGWLLLGRSQMALNRPTAAVPAFKRAVELAGEVPQILLQYADALAMADAGRIGEESTALVKRALELEPDNVTALWFAGIGQAQLGEHEQALTFLRKARALAERGGEKNFELDAAIHELETNAEIKPAKQTPAPSASITAHIELAQSLNPLVTTDDSVFIYARTAQQGGPPLAASRITAAALPMDVVLDETMAMTPRFRMEKGQTITVTARISKHGTPTAQTGDLEGVSAPIVIGKSGNVKIVIDRIVE